MQLTDRFQTEIDNKEHVCQYET